MRQMILILGLTGLLSACGATTKGDFDCPVSQPGGCVSLAQADEIALGIMTGGVGQASTRAPLAGTEASTPPQAIIALPSAKPDDDTAMMPLVETQARAPERIISLWIAPFIDNAGHLHHSSRMGVVVVKPRWVLRAAR